MRMLTGHRPQPPQACCSLMSGHSPVPRADRQWGPHPLPASPQASLERHAVRAGFQQQQRLSSPLCFISGLRVFTLLPRY